MFNNIGKKIKGFAVFVAIVGMIIPILGGLGFIIAGAASNNIALPLLGILIAVVGSIMSWMSTWLLYGYGEIVDKTSSIDKKLDGINTNMQQLVSYTCYNYRTQQSQSQPQQQPNQPVYGQPAAQPQTPVYQQSPAYQQQPVYSQPQVQPQAQPQVQPQVPPQVPPQPQPQPPVTPAADPKNESNPLVTPGDGGYNNIIL